MSLKIEGLTKTFDSPEGEVVAIEDFSIDVEDGEFVVFVGPSGCGKTTTLRCIGGLETPTTGEIYLKGDRIDPLPPQERDIAMVFQNYALYPHLSVEQNLGFGLKNRTDLSSSEIREQVADIAEMMGIEDLLKKNPDQLSGGQQQRVATGRAIVRDPDLFLFDEPLSNLDAKLRKHMRTEIQSIQNEFGTTAVYVTHDQEEAMTMADKMVVLKDGQLQQIGAPTEVYRNPANQFVAGFIGEPSMNFFEVSFDGTTLTNGAFTYELPPQLIDEIEPETELTLGVRPEDVAIASDGNIEAQLSLLEELGDENLLYLEVGEDECIAQTAPDIMFDTGDTVHFDFDQNNIYLFDGESGETLVSSGSLFEQRTVSESVA